MNKYKKRKQNRLTVVKNGNRLLEYYDVDVIESIQDEGRTLKLFLRDKVENNNQMPVADNEKCLTDREKDIFNYVESLLEECRIKHNEQYLLKGGWTYKDLAEHYSEKLMKARMELLNLRRVMEGQKQLDLSKTIHTDFGTWKGDLNE